MELAARDRRITLAGIEVTDREAAAVHLKAFTFGTLGDIDGKFVPFVFASRENELRFEETIVFNRLIHSEALEEFGRHREQFAAREVDNTVNSP